MTAKCFIRGHKVYYDEKIQKWLFDNEKLNNTNMQTCPRCCQPHLPNDCDYCLKQLIDCKFIISACCGHSKERGYIKLADGRVFREEI